MSSLGTKLWTIIRQPSILASYARWILASQVEGERVMTINGVKIAGFFGFSSYLGAFSNRPDEVEMDHLKRNIPVGGVVLDVGANFGVMSVIMSRLSDPGGHVFAFEPIPTTFKTLEKNIRRNGCSNVTCLGLGVGAKTGTLRFTDSTDAATNRMDPAADLAVPVTSVDEFCAEKDIDRIDFLKIDVEGAELQVLEGSRQHFEAGLIAAGMIEVCPGNLARFGITMVDLHRALTGWGYYLHWFDAPEIELTEDTLTQLSKTFLGNAGFRRRA